MNDTARELVDCNVRATPALARRVRKAIFAEQEGHDARAALMVAADCDPVELDTLRERLNELSDNLDANDQRLSSLKSQVDKLRGDLSQARKQLGERDKTIGNLRKVEKSATDRIVALEATLEHSIDNKGLPLETIGSIRSVVDAIRGGHDSKSALLNAANYDRNAVEAALSAMPKLQATNEKYARKLAPLEAVLVSGGLRAFIARRFLRL